MAKKDGGTKPKEPVKSWTCKCGMSIDNGFTRHRPHPKAYIEKRDLKYYAIIKCTMCGMKVPLSTIEEQYKGGDKWYQTRLLGKVICSHCSHELDFDQ